MDIRAKTGRAAAILFTAVVAMSLAANGAIAIAQDSDLEARVTDRHKDYIEAATSGDVDAYLALFADDAVIMPITGGTFDGTEEIRRYFEEAGQAQALEIEPDRVDRIGDVIVDIGTFSLTLPDEAGGQEVDGGYVVLAHEENGEVVIQRLVSFPPRGAPTPE